MTSPYGSWLSPITSERIVAESVGLSEVIPAGDAVYWIEDRPSENGRCVIVRRGTDGRPVDLNPLSAVAGTGPVLNVRTRVHELGGGAWLVVGDAAYGSNFDDQRLYRVPVAGGAPVPITPAYEVTATRDGVPESHSDVVRYADATPDPGRRRLLCVMEDHRQAFRPDGSEDVTRVVNSLAAVCLDEVGDPVPIASGHDFYSNPRLSPDGKRLAWLTWDHPRMPWIGTELWVADLSDDGSMGTPYKAAGGPTVSIFQPEWSPDGRLYYISDESGWWNLYRHDPAGAVAVCPKPAEFGQPQWNFRLSTYAFRSATEVICTYGESGRYTLARLDLETGAISALDLGLAETLTEFGSVRVQGDQFVFLGGSPALPPAYYVMDLGPRTPARPLRWALQKAGPAAGATGSPSADPEHSVGDLRAYLSTPVPVEFPTARGKTAHGLFYRPHNPDFSAPAGERPPLVVMCHGGPTAAASSCLDLRIQFWTSRGIAVLDVDYGGSTGYGRAYRDRLNLAWGIVDVEDCINGAKYLSGLAPDGTRDPALEERVDPDRAIITGGSAGGYTTLAALTFQDFFKGGASYYGVSDTEALVRDTHKFESRYLDWLIGPYPQQKAVYQERSPIHHIALLASRKTPLIFFQGDEDRIVPPNQTEMMVEALKKERVPVGYLLFRGEQHGFRKGANIQRALDSELFFYSVMILRSGLTY
jgi:dipeptidyl aminopeptidase/acylaminoacyl peptidase